MNLSINKTLPCHTLKNVRRYCKKNDFYWTIQILNKKLSVIRDLSLNLLSQLSAATSWCRTRISRTSTAPWTTHSILILILNVQKYQNYKKIKNPIGRARYRIKDSGGSEISQMGAPTSEGYQPTIWPFLSKAARKWRNICVCVNVKVLYWVNGDANAHAENGFRSILCIIHWLNTKLDEDIDVDANADVTCKQGFSPEGDGDVPWSL